MEQSITSSPKNWTGEKLDVIMKDVVSGPVEISSEEETTEKVVEETTEE